MNGANPFFLINAYLYILQTQIYEIFNTSKINEFIDILVWKVNEDTHQSKGLSCFPLDE